MIIFSRELFSSDKLFETLRWDGDFRPEKELVEWLTEQFGEYGDRWTYYYLIDSYQYDCDINNIQCVAVDVAWDFTNDEDAMLFKLSWSGQ